ncbi:hypothetical protein LIER_30330 [Lithospermum erythrorhizon]|uniref:H(+)-exporting diphosphatase n=1 Tax=Lithospermum erythrorhizon TaxID=34254 RepID=A0AAV3RQZ7_LITER
MRYFWLRLESIKKSIHKFKKASSWIPVWAMLPYWFSAMTMKSVGSAALKMVEEVRRQFNTIPGLMEGTAKPDYANCVKISTDASIKEMIPPGCLVMLTPLIVGTFFGVETLLIGESSSAFLIVFH